MWSYITSWPRSRESIGIFNCTEISYQARFLWNKMGLRLSIYLYHTNAQNQGISRGLRRNGQRLPDAHISSACLHYGIHSDSMALLIARERFCRKETTSNLVNVKVFLCQRQEYVRKFPKYASFFRKEQTKDKTLQNKNSNIHNANAMCIS